MKEEDLNKPPAVVQAAKKEGDSDSESEFDPDDHDDEYSAPEAVKVNSIPISPENVKAKPTPVA